MNRKLIKLAGTMLFVGALFAFVGCDKPTDENGGNKKPEKEADYAVDEDGKKFEIRESSISFTNYTSTQYSYNNIILAKKYTKADFKVVVQDSFGDHKADVTDSAEIYINDVKLTDEGITLEHKKLYSFYAIYKGKNSEYKSYEYKDIYAALENDIVGKSSKISSVEGYCTPESSFGSYKLVRVKSDGTMDLKSMETGEETKRKEFSFWVGSSFDTAKKIDCDIVTYKFTKDDKIIILAAADEASLNSSKAYPQLEVQLYLLSDVDTVALGGSGRSINVGDTLSGTNWNDCLSSNTLGDFIFLVNMGDTADNLAKMYITNDEGLLDGITLSIYDNPGFTGSARAIITKDSGSWTPNEEDSGKKMYIKTSITMGEKLYETPQNYRNDRYTGYRINVK